LYIRKDNILVQNGGEGQRMTVRGVGSRLIASVYDEKKTNVANAPGSVTLLARCGDLVGLAVNACEEAVVVLVFGETAGGRFDDARYAIWVVRYGTWDVT
jgi:hypothetical protein